MAPMKPLETDDAWAPSVGARPVPDARCVVRVRVSDIALRNRSEIQLQGSVRSLAMGAARGR